MVEILSFTEEQVDRDVYKLLLDNELYDNIHASENTGLYGCYMAFFDEDYSCLTHVWIAKEDGACVGVCALRPDGDGTVNVYVKPEHRRKGVGSLLLQKAMATNVVFGAIHTDTGKYLYGKYGVADYKLNPPWALD